MYHCFFKRACANCYSFYLSHGFDDLFRRFALFFFSPQQFTVRQNQGCYTQVTSRYRIQSAVIDSRSRKTTQCNSQLFPSCLTQKSGQ
ncbi:hypothetical protein AL540_012820 [Vibrio harveyi]|nr:hypothetical protein AL540_012820 [Vibrio harveyi]